ncbi:MAG: antibiotic biosynthesis monooxygenase [Bacteroidales bacterium]|jgi:quinol monooxygenase YgiN|nr:antibiotic biosynthesis monooxygenase [Bacteroidales bacterium]
MIILQVFVHVKKERVGDFKKATTENARNSIKEPGVARFDVIQQQDDPTRFVLVEVYRKPEDPAKHKETDHYKKWVSEVADMLSEPRTRNQFINIYPNDEEWG